MSFGKKNPWFFSLSSLTLLFIILLVGVGTAYAAEPFEYKLLESIPLVGDSKDTISLTTLIVGIYKLALWTVGIAALFMLSVGGFYYVSSAGNAATASTAKKIITDAFLGLFMAIASWLLLYVINPDLVQNDVANIQLFNVSVKEKTGTIGEKAITGNPAGGYVSTYNNSTGGVTGSGGSGTTANQSTKDDWNATNNADAAAAAAKAAIDAAAAADAAGTGG